MLDCLKECLGQYLPSIGWLMLGLAALCILGAILGGLFSGGIGAPAAIAIIAKCIGVAIASTSITALVKCIWNCI